MTREELIKSIYHGMNCQNPNCPTELSCDECIENQVSEYEKQIKEKTLKEFIEMAEKEKDDIYCWDEDDYENGLRAGYQRSIEIAEQLKEE